MEQFASPYALAFAISQEDKDMLEFVWHDKDRYKRRLDAITQQFKGSRYIHTLYLPLLDADGKKIGYYPHDTYKYLDMMVESYQKKGKSIIYVWNVNSEIKRAFAANADVIFVTHFY